MKKSSNWASKAIIFLSSQMFSMFGSSIVAYAVIWYITLETSSASLMTVSIISSFVPQLFISLFAGVWADRHNRKTIIIISDLLTASATLLLAIIMFNGVRSFTIIFIICAIRSIGAGIQAPAVNALLPQIVPQENLTKVNGINSSLNSALMLLAPAAGGVVLGTLGFSYALLVDVFTAVIAVSIMMFLKVEKPAGAVQEISMIKDLKEGLAYATNHKIVRKLLIFYTIFFFLITPAAFLTPIMIERSFGDEVWRLTANEMVWTAGAILGGIIITAWGGFKNKLMTMAFSCAGFGITFGLLGVVDNFWTYLIIMAISGIFTPMFSTAETVLIQESVEETMLGRVFSMVQIIASSAIPLGMLLFGPLGDIIRIETILIISGICLVLLAPFILKGVKE